MCIARNLPRGYIITGPPSPKFRNIHVFIQISTIIKILYLKIYMDGPNVSQQTFTQSSIPSKLAVKGSHIFRVFYQYCIKTDKLAISFISKLQQSFFVHSHKYQMIDFQRAEEISFWKKWESGNSSTNVICKVISR